MYDMINFSETKGILKWNLQVSLKWSVGEGNRLDGKQYEGWEMIIYRIWYYKKHEI